MPSVPTLLCLYLTLGSGPHELMGFSEQGLLENTSRASAVPHSLIAAPQKWRLLLRLARLDSPKVKALARLVALLQPAY